MLFTTLMFTGLVAASAISSPNPSRRSAHLRRSGLAGLCPGIDSPLCCETDVDGIVDLTCSSPTTEPTDIASFEQICEAKGLTAECCTLPADGDALLCTAT